MKLWLLRHARVLAEPGLCYGATDLPADAADTRAAAQAAATRLPPGLPVWSSTLQRASALAQALCALRPDLLPHPANPRLNEMDFGHWEGQPWSAIPRAAVDAWTQDFAQHRFGGRECVQDVLRRVAQALADTHKRVGHAGEGVWVTHAGVIRAVDYLRTHGATSPVTATDWPTTDVGHGTLRCVCISLNAALQS